MFTVRKLETDPLVFINKIKYINIVSSFSWGLNTIRTHHCVPDDTGKSLELGHVVQPLGVSPVHWCNGRRQDLTSRPVTTGKSCTRSL